MNLLKYKHIDEAENVKIWLSVDPGSDEASDGNQISHYIYDANGERAMKYCIGSIHHDKAEDSLLLQLITEIV